MPTDFRAPFMRTFGLSLLCVLYGSLVVRCGIRKGAGDPVSRLMRNRWLAFLGKYSYAIYVLHLFVTYYCNRAEGILLARLGAAWMLPLAFAAVVVTLAGSSAAALISWSLLEKPCLEQKRHFPYLEGPTREPVALSTSNTGG